MAAYFPDPKTADLVRRYVRAGVTDTKRIAKIIKITERRLLDHYQYELGYTDDEELANVTDVAYDMATNGKFPHMTIFWLRQKGGVVWQEKKEAETGTAINPIVVMLKGDKPSGEPEGTINDEPEY